MSGDFSYPENSCVEYTVVFIIRSHLLLSKNMDFCSSFFQRLAKQLEDLDIPFTEDFPAAIQSTDHVLDAIFGVSS